MTLSNFTLANLTLADLAKGVLTAADPDEKVRLTRAAADAWDAGHIVAIGTTPPPTRPARPERPELCSPRAMPKRSTGGEKGRMALLHAIAHIELNAIDLAWDMVARFADEHMPKAFYDDWVGVARDEAEHFALLDNHLAKLGVAYGDHAAHDGLWEAADKTTHDLLARLALVPMVLEARGLDTTPATVTKLRAQGGDEAAAILEKIAREEIPHVAAGVRWFEYLCEKRGLEPASTFRRLVKDLYLGTLKPPFNVAARTQAGMAAAYYQELAARP